MKIQKSIKYYTNRDIKREYWHKENDTLYWHREDGPAYIRYWDTGEKEREEWWVADKLHKLDGPAYIVYNSDGTAIYEKYYINGEKMSKEEWEDHPLRQDYIIKEAIKEAMEEL